MRYKQSKHALDEMQENQLLRIEEIGFWITFWSIFAVIVIQAIIEPNFKTVAGEIVVLLIASIYIAVTSIQNGLWSKSHIPTLKSNVISSCIPAVFLGGIYAIRAFGILKKDITSSIVCKIAIVMIGIYVICLAMLEVLRLLYNKRRSRLEKMDED